MSTGGYLSPSGMFMLKIVSSNTPSIEFLDYLAALWDYFKQNRLHSLIPYGVPAVKQDTNGTASSGSISVKEHYKPTHPIDYVDTDGDFVAIL